MSLKVVFLFPSFLVITVFIYTSRSVPEEADAEDFQSENSGRFKKNFTEKIKFLDEPLNC